MGQQEVLTVHEFSVLSWLESSTVQMFSPNVETNFFRILRKYYLRKLFQSIGKATTLVKQLAGQSYWQPSIQGLLLSER